MKLTKEEKERLEAIYQEFLNDERIKRMKEVPMHFGFSATDRLSSHRKHALS